MKPAAENGRRSRYETLLPAALLIAVLCQGKQLLTVAAAQEQRTRVADSDHAVTAKSGVAGGLWSPALTGERRPLYRLCKSDVVEVDFTFSPEFNQTVIVQPDGFITLRAVSQLRAEGLTMPELQQAIQSAYGGTLNEPEVTIVLKDFEKPSFIAGGEVGHPGKYELRADTTVMSAIQLAGGFTVQAKHSQVILFRRVSDELVESRVLDMKSLIRSRNLGEDVHLRPGDLLFVPKNTMSKVRQYLPVASLSTYLNPGQF
jgi:polysaccharide export outer membrane protein